eukprot:CCRYP_014710-RA/>CCRYP_014710-RA protein AED:0.34 eAED:0.26 QI:0/0/0/1/0/0/2/0/588
MPNLNTTAIIDTGANISLLNTNAPASCSQEQSLPKSIIQPKGPILTTTENLVLLLNNLPHDARLAYRKPGIKNNLLAASGLVDAGCELFFHQHGCEITQNGEIILQGWRDTDTKLWRISLLPDGGQTVLPQQAEIRDMFEVPTALLTNNVYECNNTNELINYYYATMGYPVTLTWCKAIDRGYFRRWPGLTSDRVRRFIKPSHACEQGHMDQRRAGIRSTKSSHDSTPTPTNDHMEDQEQTPQNDKAHMVFMTLIEVAGQLFTDQTGRLPVTSNRGNNYIVIFYAVNPNYIKAYPIKSRHRSELLKADEEVYSFLRVRGYRPQLHMLDNETSHDVETYEMAHLPDPVQTNYNATPTPTVTPGPHTHQIPFDDGEYTKPTNAPRRYNLCSRGVNLIQHTTTATQNTAKQLVVHAVLNEDSGKILEYRQLIKHPKYADTWTTSYANELGRLTQGIRDIPGTNTMTFIHQKDIPHNRLKDVTFGKIVTDFRPQKTEPNRTRLTVVGTYIDYPWDVATPTSDLTTAKLLFNSVISTPNATFHGMDLKNFYLNTPMERPEYMKLKLAIILEEIIVKYNLREKQQGWVYVRIDL